MKKVKIRFHWIPELTRWEVREMHGLYTFSQRGTITFRKSPAGFGQWHVELDTNLTWLGSVHQILWIFDLVEQALNGESQALELLDSF
jgi:hypothetical protein